MTRRLCLCVLLAAAFLDTRARPLDAQDRLLFDSLAPDGTLVDTNALLANPSPWDPLFSSTFMIGGDGQLFVRGPGGQFVPLADPYGPDYHGPINLALGQFDLTTSQLPTGLLVGPGGPADLPMVLYDFGPPLSRIGDLPVPGAGSGLVVTVGNITADATDEIILSREGAPTIIILVPGQDRITTVRPFQPSYTGGVRVETGNLNTDPREEVIVSQTNGGAISVLDMIDLDNPREVARGIAFDVPPTRGVWTAVSDVNHDGVGDILAAAGSGAPHIRIFNGRAPATSVLGDFHPFQGVMTEGTRVAAGIINGQAAVVATSTRYVQVYAPTRAGWAPIGEFFHTIGATAPAENGTLAASIFTPVRPR